MGAPVDSTLSGWSFWEGRGRLCTPNESRAAASRDVGVGTEVAGEGVCRHAMSSTLATRAYLRRLTFIVVPRAALVLGFSEGSFGVPFDQVV